MTIFKHWRWILLGAVLFWMEAGLRGQEKVDLLGYRLAYHWDSAVYGGFNDIWGWTDSNGREYAIMGSWDATFFFDITNPDSVRLVQVEHGWYNRCIHRDYKTYQHYCYGVADEGNSSLQVFDLSYLPDSVHKVYDSDAICYRSHNVFIDTARGMLYLAAASYRENGQRRVSGVSVVSLDTPAHPRLIKHHPPSTFGGGRSHDVFAYQDTVLLSLEWIGLAMYDFQRPDSPVRISSISSYPGKGYNHSSWAAPQRDVLVFADETHGSPLKVYDYSNPQLPVLKSTFGSAYSSGSIPHNPIIAHDSIVWISYYHEGVVAYNIADPNNPQKVFQYDTYPDNDNTIGGVSYQGYEGCWGVYPLFPSGAVVASDMTYGLFVFVPEIDTTTSVVSPSPASLMTLNVQPNPAVAQVRIAFPDDVPMPRRPLVIYDARGRIVHREGPAAQREVTVAVDRWVPGIYLIRWGSAVATFQKVE